MNKKLQVFVSSTYTDLNDERQAAVEAILDAGHIPAGMELFKAGKSQMETIRKWIDESDVYMLILGGRYGSIEEESGLSYTELEYRYAISKNMPVFAIVLDESFLHVKAASSGSEIIFEKDNFDKYNHFKKDVKSNIVKFAKNIDQISTIIHSHLNEILDDPDYNLIGWTKSNETFNDINVCSNDLLVKTFNRIYNELVFRNTQRRFNYYSDFISSKIIEMTQVKALLESLKRIVELELISNEQLVKVTTTQIMKFLYIQNNEPYYKLYVETTKQQLDTFKVNSLLINNIDFTPQIKLSYTKEPHKGQFIYTITSDFIPPNLETCEVYYQYNYECPSLDFFQTFRLSYPCNDFSALVILKNDLNKQYSILGSTFSSFSKIYNDNFKASEMYTNGSCNIKLPNWSLPGAGYAVTLKNKSEKNHI